MTDDEKEQIVAIMSGYINLHGNELLDMLYDMSDELEENPNLPSESKELLEKIIQMAKQKDLRIN